MDNFIFGGDYKEDWKKLEISKLEDDELRFTGMDVKRDGERII